ncbi:hypothetical protein [Desulfitobacterium sp. AusDCA]|uniref:hypothetical protein n=1 Tax=Desulfitobacterium sp. AusDCA TaxID=3240383 RepID=UPI003DA795ED
MSSYAMFVKNKLTSIIEMMLEKKENFAKDSDKDFVRMRKLSFETVVKMPLSMSNENLNKELLEYFNYDLQAASSSAFVQQRKKLLPEAFQFYLMNSHIPSMITKPMKGIGLLRLTGQT